MRNCSDASSDTEMQVKTYPYLRYSIILVLLISCHSLTSKKTHSRNNRFAVLYNHSLNSYHSQVGELNFAHFELNSCQSI